MLNYLENQQKLTGNQRRIILAAILGDMLEFFDYFLIGFVVAFIAAPWKLTFGQSAIILLASGFGAMFGAVFYGWLADKIGRRKTFILTVVNFSLATGALAFTPDGAWLFLAVFRFIIGFGTGGLYCVDLPLVQEFVPSSKRGMVGGLVTASVPLGILIGALPGSDRHALYRLARAFCRGAYSGSSHVAHPRLGSRIAALADAHGSIRGSARLVGLGARNGPSRNSSEFPRGRAAANFPVSGYF